jgi:Secretion system C-terminal sorting domain
MDNKFDYSSIRRVNFDSKYTYSIYPNPVNDVLRITVDDAAGLNADVQVLNMQSQLLINKKLNTIQPLQLNVSSLTAGIYFIKIVSADRTISIQKFVKQ